MGSNQEFGRSLHALSDDTRLVRLSRVRQPRWTKVQGLSFLRCGTGVLSRVLCKLWCRDRTRCWILPSVRSAQEPARHRCGAFAVAGPTTTRREYGREHGYQEYREFVLVADGVWSVQQGRVRASDRPRGRARWRHSLYPNQASVSTYVSWDRTLSDASGSLSILMNGLLTCRM